jgi:hypothetical protein
VPLGEPGPGLGRRAEDGELLQERPGLRWHRAREARRVGGNHRLDLALESLARERSAIERPHCREVERHEPRGPGARLFRIVSHDGRDRRVDGNAPLASAGPRGALAQERLALGETPARVHERQPAIGQLAREPYRLVGERGQEDRQIGRRREIQLEGPG